MTRRILLFCFLAGFFVKGYGQSSIPDSLAMLFYQQLVAFPQEKIYLHTDKPYYISGEKIWFRAHLADAINHVPSPVSRYVYVELISPLDSIVTRVKIRQEEEAYHGYLLIPDDLPEGDYMMRAYTTFMRSLDEHYFCTKTIRISDPQARAIQTDARFTFESGRRVNATFRFSQVNPVEPLVPKSVKISVNDGRSMNVKVDDDGTASVNFNLPATSPKRVILLETLVFQHPYRQYIKVPAPNDDFDITFYPEGGSLMMGTSCKVAFNAMKSNGQSMDVNGVIYDQNGVETGTFKSDYLGMGSFSLLAEKGKTYYAVCKDEQEQMKRFDLPAAVEHGYAISVSHVRDKLYVSVLKPAEQTKNEDIYLLAHTRGMVQFGGLWDHDKNIAIISKEQFSSGVLHFILFDTHLNPISERLFFINRQDQAKVDYDLDKGNYSARSLVKNMVTIADSKGEPLTGSFSVSVTSDKEVTPDSTSNILTQLLLASDLHGHVENPAFYFKNTTTSAWALDLLMRTQGWRRYNIAELAQGRFLRPTSPLEIGPVISGIVKSVLLGRAVEDMEVTAMSLKGNYFDNTKTDKDGRFLLAGGELPDSTRIIVTAVLRKGITRMELIIDRETFPERTIPIVPAAEIDKIMIARYADKAEQQYVYENGVRVYQLSDVVVTATRTPPRKSTYYSSPSNSITEQELEKFPVTDIRTLLMRLPGVVVTGNSVSIRGQGEPLLVVDDIPSDIEYLDMINVYDVAQIDVLKDAGNTAMFGSRGGNGVIVIFTKDGKINPIVNKPFHIKTIMPLGYQTPLEFYAPKYDTPAKQRAQKPDLRTTIHWQPVVQTDSLGMASFEFYTADENPSYTVTIEGLANDGKIIRQERTLWRRNER